MINFNKYDFDAKITKAYKDLLGKENEKIHTGNDPYKLGEALSYLEQDINMKLGNTHASFNNSKELATRVGWLLSNNFSKFNDNKELSDLYYLVDKWLMNVYEVFGKEYI